MDRSGDRNVDCCGNFDTLREQPRQRAGQHVAGAGGIDRSDRRSGDQRAAMVGGQHRTDAAAADDHRARTGAQQCNLGLILAAGKLRHFDRIGDDDIDAVQQRYHPWLYRRSVQHDARTLRPRLLDRHCGRRFRQVSLNQQDIAGAQCRARGRHICRLHRTGRCGGADDHVLALCVDPDRRDVGRQRSGEPVGIEAGFRCHRMHQKVAVGVSRYRGAQPRRRTGTRRRDRLVQPLAAGANNHRATQQRFAR